MNIVHVNNIDVPGNRFNGHDLQIDLNRRGHQAHQIVMHKYGKDPNTVPIIQPSLYVTQEKLMAFESNLSMHGLIYPWGRRIMEMPEFQQADVVHYHLIHNYLISLFDFEDMVRAKPSVWTLHDPWAVTGHCVHPKTCDRWKTGCHSCPSLDAVFPIKYDKAYQMWNIKKEIYSKLDLDLIVSSKFMMDYVANSPLTRHFERVHLIPFGIDLENFGVKSTSEARKEFGIADDQTVIAFRATPSEFKGLPYIIEALEKLKPSKKITILTVGLTGYLEKFKSKFSVVDIGWVTEDEKMAAFYAACDIFLMPSAAESFGLMAVEAMASGKPVVVFDETALPDVTFAPDCGYVVRQGDADGLYAAIKRLLTNPEERERRGRLGKELALKHYGYETYFNKLMLVYEEAISRRKQSK